MAPLPLSQESQFGALGTHFDVSNQPPHLFPAARSGFESTP
jgi:hypothetical protein